MLILKPPSIDKSVASASILAITFIAHANLIHPQACIQVRLLGPCFKTGRVQPFALRAPHARVRTRTFTPWGSYHALEIFLRREATLTDKVRSTVRCLRVIRWHACAGTASTGGSTQQPHPRHFGFAHFLSSNFKHFYLSFQSPFQLSLMVLVCYRS